MVILIVFLTQKKRSNSLKFFLYFLLGMPIFFVQIFRLLEITFFKTIRNILQQQTKITTKKATTKKRRIV